MAIMQSLIGTSTLTKSFTFVSSQVGVGNTIQIPSSARENDFAILFNGYASNSIESEGDVTTIPSGWIKITSSYFASFITDPNTVGASVSYKILSSSDPGSTITAIGPLPMKTLLVFRPDSKINGITLGNINQQATSGNPSQQTVLLSQNDTPSLAFGHWKATLSITARTVSGIPMTEVSNISTSPPFTGQQYVKYSMFSAGQPTNDFTVDMNDVDVNILQSFYISFL